MFRQIYETIKTGISSGMQLYTWLSVQAEVSCPAQIEETSVCCFLRLVTLDLSFGLIELCGQAKDKTSITGADAVKEKEKGNRFQATVKAATAANASSASAKSAAAPRYTASTVLIF